MQPRLLAAGEGWRILDVLCTCDAHDRPGEERHSHYSLALVLGGAFHYRGRSGAAYLPAGSILMGRAGAPFSCWHGHGAGDRCLAIQFEADAFEEFASSHHHGHDPRHWPTAIPVDRRTAGLFACAELIAADASLAADEGLGLAVTMADRIVHMASQVSQPQMRARPRDADKVLELARWIETDPAADHALPALARRAGMSKYHLVRVFRRIVGVPPYAFVRRARLRDAALELVSGDGPIVDLALRAGFPDQSTFNAALKRQFGHAPRELRRRIRASQRTIDLVSLEAGASR